MNNACYIVCGGRDFADYPLVCSTLDNLRASFDGDFRIIQGGAKGADRLAKQWARERLISYYQYDANWEKHGKAAGPIRNTEMLRRLLDFRLLLPYNIGVVAFPGGTGTANMIDQARKANIEVKEIVS
jgi:hypothetical protein